MKQLLGTFAKTPGDNKREIRLWACFQYLMRWFLLALMLGLSGFATAAPSLLVSSFPDRSSPASLSGMELTDDVYIFAAPIDGIRRVEFYFDSPPPSTLFKRENVAPFDLGGTADNDLALPFNTNAINDGQHTLYALVTYTSGATEVLSAAFTVNNAVPQLEFSNASFSFLATENDTQTQSANVSLETNQSANADFSISDDASWLSVSPSSGTTPDVLTLTASPNGLAPGSYTANVTATANGYASDSLTVVLEIVPDDSSLYPIVYSLAADRSGANGLQGATVSGDVYVFVPDNQSITRVYFYINDPLKTGAPDKKENLPPYDLAGTTATDLAIPFDTTSLPEGNNTLTAVVLAKDGTTHETTVFFTVSNDSATLNFAQTSLAGSRPVGSTDVLQQNVNLTSSDNSGAPFDITSNASWLTFSTNSGTTPATITVKASPDGLAAGNYTGKLTADADGYIAGELVYTLTITDDPDTLVASPASLVFSGTPGSTIASQTLNITHSNSESHAFTVSTNMPWLQASPTSGNTPDSIQVSVDGTGLASGSYGATLTITASGFPNVDVPVTLNLTSNDKCAPVVCTDVKVDLPYQLTFTESQGHLMDKNGLGTGFTWVDQPSAGTGYIPDNLEMNFLDGVLNLTTTSGIQYLSNNSQDNALGVGFAAPNQITRITTQLKNVPTGTGNYEQAGLWFGTDEDNYIKLVIISRPEGPRLHYLMEIGGLTAVERTVAAGDLYGKDITFMMVVNPYTRTVEVHYAIEGGTTNQLATLSPPDEFFSFDAAGIDPEIGTRSFAGIFATNRGSATPQTYQFDEFTLEVGGTPESPSSSLDFVRKNYNVDYPTSMVWGPDDRLYVAQLFGSVEALTFDDDFNIIDQQTITSLQDAIGPRLTLGITVSPTSTASNVELWLAHSSPSVDNGEPNSGMVSRLYGPNFSQVQHVITGLPRAKANHSINSIHFGADNRLYIAMGGNTGAGAPNNSNSEFGTMQEQPLSAAILVADVFAAGFDGTCANTSDIFGPPPCDVQTYATGLRNSYDFVFHSNGKMYATDNGLGVTGTYPPTPTPPCLGFGDTASYLNGGDNPGVQPDLLHLVNEGDYFGHPNPYRDECVFKDGHYQGVAPLPNYVEPFFNLGDHKSANGIIEYKGATGCVGDFLNGQLLIADYSIGDDVFRVQLSEDGNSVIEGTPLITGFNDPLPLAQTPNGVIFVGQFGGDKLTSLQPVSLGCWGNDANLPVSILDAAGAAIGDKMYVVGGKNSNGHLTSLWIYNASTNSWSQGANLPGVGVENAAVVAHNGQLYVFGGSTEPFSGAVSNAAVYNPGSNSWTSLPNMPTARGGATAQVINGVIYVAGGMNGSGASLATVEAYTPASGTWQTVTPLQTRRDNPGSAVLNNELYVFGGRIRNADGSTIDPTLVSMEKYSPATGTWTGQTPMPTGRRAMAVGTANGRIQVIGGEQNPDSPSGVFEQNEEYDPATQTWRSLVKIPSPRHGPASATINNSVHVVGGGLSTGTTFSTLHEVLSF